MRSRIGALRDDEKFSFSRERSELSFFLNSPCSTLHSPRLSRAHTPSAGACRHPSRRGDPRSKAEERSRARSFVPRSDASRPSSWLRTTRSRILDDLLALQGRVHALGRRTKDGFSASNALLGGRWTAVDVSLALPALYTLLSSITSFHRLQA